ncbi:MAG TPA: zinc-dependent metalloprotease [Burkholderiaceae bacterium]
MPQNRPIPSLTVLASACLALLSACATAPEAAQPPGTITEVAAAEPAQAASAATPASGASAAAAKAGAPARAAAPSGPPLPPFATVTQGARKVEGMLNLWQKEDKVWLELRPEDFNKPMFFSPKISQGLGEGGVFGGTVMRAYSPWGAPQIVEFRKIHNMVQLVALNETFRAKAGTPEARAVAAAYSSSLVGSAPVASQADASSHGVLVEANNLFLVDTLGMAIHLQQMYRQGYGFDQRNSYFDGVRGTADEVMFDVTAHYFTQSIATSFPNAPANTPQPTLPSFVPDARSLFLGLHYSLARLPDKPMATRPADPRVGYFTTTVADFTDDLARSPRERFVNHWRLEKKDPAAALSEPVKPITYWLDRSIPVKYRAAITRGILEWNKAFERIGFKDAIVVKVQPEDANFDTLDVGVTSVRWTVNADPQYGAIGPTHVDPRTGEILDAAISIESLSSRDLRNVRSQVLDPAGSASLSSLLQAPASELPPAAATVGRSAAAASADFCMAGPYEAEQAGYGLDVLAARGEIDPDSPEAEAYVEAYLQDVTMHEVGHTLGLRHNFRASRMNSEKDLDNPEFTKTHPLGGSVMDYLPINLPRPGEPAGKPFDSTLGPYDYWAIEYAYKPLPPDATPAQQKAELLRIASRNTEPGLDYGTDEDNFLGVDPAALQGDLGADPVAYAKKRIAIARDLFARQESRTLKPTEDYGVLRRSVTFALRDATRSAGVLLRQLGGVSTLRDFPGSGRDPMEPVPGNVQRAALDTLVDGVLAADSFRVSPALQRRLAPDFLERGDTSAGGDPVPTDYPVESVMLGLQRQVLAALMSDGLAQRLEDSAPKLDRAAQAQALTTAEVYARITRSLWQDAANFGPDGKGDIPARRRELQRDHVNHLAAVLLRTPGGVRVDMRSTQRAEAVALLPRIEAARRRPGLSEATRLHLADCAETLRVALAAPMQRAGY